MAIPKGCPCTKDCQRRGAGCKTCKDFVAYKNNKMKEYEKRRTEQDFRAYEIQKENLAARKKFNFKKGGLK